MSYRAQCLLCKHAQRQGRRPSGCLRFEETQGIPLDVACVLAALLYQTAAERPCVAREGLHYGPDAYLAEDLPTGEPDDPDAR